MTCETFVALDIEYYQPIADALEARWNANFPSGTGGMIYAFCPLEMGTNPDVLITELPLLDDYRPN